MVGVQGSRLAVTPCVISLLRRSVALRRAAKLNVLGSVCQETAGFQASSGVVSAEVGAGVVSQ